tara:strand:+ start:881 stop:1165 length:285 start_codon:yes stop_codon:yes gene_type:complete
MCECGYCGSKALETAILKSHLPGPPKMRSTWLFDEPTNPNSSAAQAGTPRRMGDTYSDPKVERIENGSLETHHVTGLPANYVRNLIDTPSWEFQ